MESTRKLFANTVVVERSSSWRQEFWEVWRIAASINVRVTLALCERPVQCEK